MNKKHYSRKDLQQSDLSARGEPFLWTMGGTLALGIIMIVGFLILVVWNGITTFYPKPLQRVTLNNGKTIAGEIHRKEKVKLEKHLLDKLDEKSKEMVRKNNGYTERILYKTGNFDIYNEDFKWVADYQIKSINKPENLFYIERIEWGPFVGSIESVHLGSMLIKPSEGFLERLTIAHEKAVERRETIKKIEREEISEISYDLEKDRLELKGIKLEEGKNSTQYQLENKRYLAKVDAMNQLYEKLQKKAEQIKSEDNTYTITLRESGGKIKTIRLSDMVRLYPANSISWIEKMGIYFSRWGEFLTAEPREANTEGGVMPAIFGTVIMTGLMVIVVAPFGVMSSLYLREYAKQGILVSVVRVCVNNLAGVPSIVYGVFGLGFFAYIIGGSIDSIFFAEKLPSPTFGTGGLLWASLTLALLTVPVVIVATEEALAAVPQSLREGSLACGASKWQTIKNIVLPKALPGILTGVILAMARGAGEVAPLMLVGVVKLAPELPIDAHFPFIHLERSFMHLGFHIFDVGFQSRNSEAGKPMVFVTTLLLIGLIALMNALAINIRNRLNRKYSTGHF